MTEVDDNYYAKLDTLYMKLADAYDKDTVLSKSLDIVAAEEARAAADEFYILYKKTLAVELQKREGKMYLRYREVTIALGSVRRQITLLKGQIDTMDKRFEEWRTRSANRRHGLS
jgi:hypothetical protein